jgi:AcrR family transcriptional regulator
MVEATPESAQGRLVVSGTLTQAKAPSRRDAHKNRTRRALQQAALKLFAVNGYDATTAEEIAEKAGVSARTFFRYFPTKESVLFVGERAWVESFARVYRGQQDSLRDVDAICATLIELAAEVPRGRASLRMYRRAVASSATLRGRVQDHHREDVEHVADAIAARRGLQRADEASALLAAVAVLTYQRALDAWVAGPANAQLTELIAEEFRLLAEPFTQERARPKRGSAAS